MVNVQTRPSQSAILAKWPAAAPSNSRHNNNHMPFSPSPEQKQTAFWLALWLAFALLLYALGPILTPFIAAAILAYALNGAVDSLERARLGRWHLPRALAVHAGGAGVPGRRSAPWC